MADGIVTSLPVEEKPGSKVHKPLAEILGIKKTGGPVEETRVAVVIDPKIAKVLRPHQIEGVKVPFLFHDNF
jgi:DNA repair and recombination RAD54-like protein